MSRPERPIASDWLALRRPADERAREASRPLLDALADHFTPSRAAAPVHVIDIGAGTGANLAWLAPRLRFRQTWTLLDHDPDLLGLIPQPGGGPVEHIDRVVAGIEDLPTLRRNADGRILVTCSAVLDLLGMPQLEGLCDYLVDRNIPALLSLSVVGDVELSPVHPSDALVNTAFNVHQGRDGLAGPLAVGQAAERLRAGGMQVQTAETPWALGSDDRDLMDRYLRDRAEAVVEQDPALASPVATWLADRLAEVRTGRLHLTVGHRDLLCLPPH